MKTFKTFLMLFIGLIVSLKGFSQPLVDTVHVAENQCDSFNFSYEYALDSVDVLYFPSQGNIYSDSSFSYIKYCPDSGYVGVDSMMVFGCFEGFCDTVQLYFYVQVVCSINVTLISDSTTPCPGGELHYDALVSDGTAPYVYSWSDGTADTGDCLAFGMTNLCVTVTDANSCQAATCLSSCPLAVSFTLDLYHCSRQPGLTVTETGGAGPFSYEWSNGDTGSTLCNPSAGIFCVFVSNTSGCYADYCDTLTGPVFSEPIVDSIDVMKNQCDTFFGLHGQGYYLDSLQIFDAALYGNLHVDSSFTYFSYCPDSGFVGVDSMLCFACIGLNDSILGCDSFKFYFYVQFACNMSVSLIADSAVCPGGGQHFTAEVIGGTPPYSYLWYDGTIDSGDCLSSTNRALTVTVTDANGCQADTFTAGCPTAVNFVLNPTICNGQPGLTAIPSGGAGPYYYQWSTGDTGATLCNLSSIGTYCVNVYNYYDCSVDMWFCDTLTGPNYCSFQYAQLNFNSQVITFYAAYDTADTLASVSWSFGDGNGSNVLNPVNNYVDYGSYYVTMNIYYTNGDSCSSTQSIYVYSDSSNIYPYCQAYFSSFVSNDTVYFIDESLYNPITWLWNFGDGDTSSLQNPYHVYSSQGNWNVCLTITDTTFSGGGNPCTSSYCQSVSNVAVQDMQAYLFHGSTVTPGYPLYVYLEYYNNGTRLMNGTVAYRYPAGTWLSYAYPLPIAVDSVNRLLTFNYDSLLPSSSNYIGVSLVADSNLPLASLVYDTMWVYPIVGDANPANNISTIIDSVVGSWDPNGKSVSPKGRGEKGLIDASTPTVSYIIHFQNTGNSAAHQVIVRDTISDNIDMATVRVTYASFKCATQIIGNELVVSFENINLPDSGADMLASQGYIAVLANLKPGLAPGTQIFNTANIFFDVNAPVITNTVVNTLPGGVSGINSINNLEFILMPNPANTEVLIKGNFADASTYELDDMLGRQLLQGRMNSSGTELNVAEMSAGIYLVKVISDDKTGAQRLVVVR